MKVYVYVVLLKEHVLCVGATIEATRQAFLDGGFSLDEYVKSVEKIQKELEEDSEAVVFLEKGYHSLDFRLYQIPLIGELPKPTNKVTINTDVFDVRITPKQLKQEQAELKSLPIFEVEEIEENEVEINNRIDQAKEDELGW